MPDRGPGVTGAPNDRLARMLRDLEAEVAELRRSRVTITSLPLPVSMGQWTFTEVDGALQATSPDGGTLTGGGPKGDPGDNGHDGNDGANGADGASLRGGSGAPASGLGGVGDIYFDESGLMGYGPKDASTGWSASFPLQAADVVATISDLGHRTARLSGSWYPTFPTTNGALILDGTASGVLSATGNIVFVPIRYPWQLSTTQLRYKIARATAAGNSVRLGIYSASAATNLPTGVPTVLGTDSTATAAERTVTFSSFTFQAGIPYWLAMQFQTMTNLQINGTVGQPAGHNPTTTAFNYTSPTLSASLLTKLNSDIGGYAAGLPSNPTFALTDILVSTAASLGTPLVMFKAT